MTGRGPVRGQAPTAAGQNWEPVVERRADVVTHAAASALHDLLDRDGERPAKGSPLPLLWHWLAFWPQSRQDDLGPDGHPRPGTLLPATQGRSRMYAGGRVTREGSVTVGGDLIRTSSVSAVATKSGRTGELMFVTVDHAIDSTAARATIREQQDFVYRGAHQYQAPPSATHADATAERDWSWSREVPIEATLLFRFSALTYNAHRIHYDRDYATAVEGYPGLVVHGPLQALLLADAIERALPGDTVSAFAFRGHAPAFDDHPLRIRLTTTGAEGVEVAAFSGHRHTMSATATLSPLLAPTGTPPCDHDNGRTSR
jgi:3-methylfumaryl-CoA hydratase